MIKGINFFLHGIAHKKKFIFNSQRIFQKTSFGERIWSLFVFFINWTTRQVHFQFRNQFVTNLLEQPGTVLWVNESNESQSQSVIHTHTSTC